MSRSPDLNYVARLKAVSYTEDYVLLQMLGYKRAEGDVPRYQRTRREMVSHTALNSITAIRTPHFMPPG